MTVNFTEPRLTYVDDHGHRRGMTLSADAPRITVGRSSRADIALTDDGQVSRLHATVEQIGGQWTIVDDGLSRNGTFVNGERLAGRHRLQTGDSIRIGNTVLSYLDNGSRVSSAKTHACDSGIPTRRSLTDAQMAVLVALCRPCQHNATYAVAASNQQIAKELFVTTETVKTHLRALFGKFGVEDLPQNQKRAKLLERAMNSGIVSERDFESEPAP
ncbi:FHA domain-containing protein [Nocardia sp. IBHARD005]|uniref:FHA domain-containing protein n=1 Tax=Nocardia sp. IBHARD005 TaxID=3457765 RepID=UPI004059A5BD